MMARSALGAPTTRSWRAGGLTGSCIGIMPRRVGGEPARPSSARDLPTSNNRAQRRHESTTADTQDRVKQPVLKKRLVTDYKKNTLTPHLEWQISRCIGRGYGPDEINRIARAYTMVPHINKGMCREISRVLKYRMVMFSGLNLVETISTMHELLPEDEELFEMFGERVIDVMDELNALNLIGIIRVYNKIQHYELLQVLVPRLQALLRDYDPQELSEMLIALAQSSTAVHDIDVLCCLLPEIMRRIQEVPLQVKITNLWCVTKMKIIHDEMLDVVARELHRPELTRGMPARQLSRLLWIYARCGQLTRVLPPLRPLVQAELGNFTAKDFARLAQALPHEDNAEFLHLLQQIAETLVASPARPSSSATRTSRGYTSSSNKGNSASTSTPAAGGDLRDEGDGAAASRDEGRADEIVPGTENAPSSPASGAASTSTTASPEQQEDPSTRPDLPFGACPGISDMGRKDVILFLYGMVRCRFLDIIETPDFDRERETRDEEGRRKDAFYTLFEYFHEEQDFFERDELERIVTTLWFHEEYRMCIELLPKSWTPVVDEVCLMLENREDSDGANLEQIEASFSNTSGGGAGPRAPLRRDESKSASSMS